MEPRFALHAQAAAVPGAAPLGWDKDATDDDEVDNGPLTGAAARKELFRRLYEKPDTDPIQFLDPHEVYARWSVTPVTAALAVLRVHRSKFERDAPVFLALLAYPSVLPFGLNSPILDTTDPLARFEPGGILPPKDGGSCPLLGSFLHDVRKLRLGSESALRANLLQSAVITWGAKGFAHVLFPAENVGFGGDASPELIPGYAASFSVLSDRCPVSDYRDPPEATDDLCFRLPIL
jgi:hypothetical protein